jgi:hypothetical protein
LLEVKKTANGGMLKAAYDIFEEAFFKKSSKKVYSSSSHQFSIRFKKCETANHKA